MEKYEPVNCLICGDKIGILPDDQPDEKIRQRYRDALRITHAGVCPQEADVVAESYELNDKPNFYGCYDPQCLDSTWDHDCPVIPGGKPFDDHSELY